MIAATSATAGAGKSHCAWRCAQRDGCTWVPRNGPRPPTARTRPGGAVARLVIATRALALGPVEQVLKILLSLREHLRGRCALDRLLDRDADDVAVLGDADDLRQPLAADLERGLIGLIPVGGHLRLGLHVGVVPGRRAADAHAGHEL